MIFRRCALLWVSCLLAVSLHAQLWTTAYYPGDAGRTLPVAEIDFSTVTHLVHFAAIPNPDGSLNLSANGIVRPAADALIVRAHAAGRKVLICVGGAETAPGFRAATSPAHRAAFASAVVKLMAQWGYDGIDLDWEPLAASDFPAFTNLVRDLRAGMDGYPGKILTAAASAYPIYGDPPNSEYALYASLQPYFAQINIMTYDLSGAYDGWVSWFNSPIYDGGRRFPSTGAPLPSIDGAVRGFLAHGVAPGKLGIGVAFYGDVWTGVWQPLQGWKTPPTVQQMPYSTIMSSLFQPAAFHWDAKSQAAWLGLPHSDRPAEFVSFDNEQACQLKVQYARDHALGGVMIWQLAHGHRLDLPAGQRDPLLQAIKQSLASPLPSRNGAAIN